MVRNLLLLLVFTGCSTRPEPTQEVIPVIITESQISSCQQYQKEVLDQAFRTVDLSANHESLKNFDVSKGLPKERAQLVSNILKQCDEEKIKDFDQRYKAFARCSLMFSELNYFQGLVKGWMKYDWPTQLKLESKQVALDYVRYFSEGNYPLLNRLVALSVLDELSVSGMVERSLHAEIKNLMEESRLYVEGLRIKLNQDQGLSCQSLGIIRDELEYSTKVSLKMKDFLKRI